MDSIDLDVSAVADWLSKHAADRLWTVDGEERLSGAIRLPCYGRELADALRRAGGTLRVFAPPGTGDEDDLAKLMETEDGSRVLEVAWVTAGEAGEPWIIAEDAFAEEAAEQAKAAHS